jgi:hypothetical protein
MSRIVVDDRMDFLSLRYLRLEGVEETNELLVPVTLHVTADDGAVEDVEGRPARPSPAASRYYRNGRRCDANKRGRDCGLSSVCRAKCAVTKCARLIPSPVPAVAGNEGKRAAAIFVPVPVS